jgi:hypothetical protein
MWFMLQPHERDSHSLPLTLIELPSTFAVCRLPADASLPSWANAGPFCSVTRTADELSIVCCQDAVPNAIPCERGWRGFRIAGTIAFSAIGILASLTAPLAAAGISIFAISTYDTDFLLVKEVDRIAAINALRNQGFTVTESVVG